MRLRGERILDVNSDKKFYFISSATNTKNQCSVPPYMSEFIKVFHQGCISTMVTSHSHNTVHLTLTIDEY